MLSITTARQWNCWGLGAWALLLLFTLTASAQSSREVFQGIATDYRLDLHGPVRQLQLRLEEWSGSVRLLNQAYDYILTTSGSPREIAARNYNRDRPLAVAHAANAETMIRNLRPNVERARGFLSDSRNAKFHDLPEFRLLDDVLNQAEAAFEGARQIPDPDSLPDPLPAPISMAGVSSVWYPDELTEGVSYELEVEVKNNCKYRSVQLAVEARVAKGEVDFEKTDPRIKQVKLTPENPTELLIWKFKTRGEGELRIGAVVIKVEPLAEKSQATADPLANAYANRVISPGRSAWVGSGLANPGDERLKNPLDENRILRQQALLKPLDLNDLLKKNEAEALGLLQQRWEAAIEDASRRASDEVNAAIRRLSDYGLLGPNEDVLARQRKDPYTAAAVASAVQLAAEHELEWIAQANANSVRELASYRTRQADLAILKSKVDPVVARCEEEYRAERVALQKRAFKEVQAIYQDLERRGLLQKINSFADWAELERTDPQFRRAKDQSEKIGDRLEVELRDSRNRSYAKMKDEIGRILVDWEKPQRPR